MRAPERLWPLLEMGVVTDVIRPLMSGKEADVFLVDVRGEWAVAKVYKEADRRSFKHRAAYTEGRNSRNTRSQRAMAKGSRFGREEVEAAWRNAEVDAIYKLEAAGVAVPRPYSFVEGVLVMELIRGFDGGPAPRLVDVELSKGEAEEIFHILIREVVKMLCAGVVHGDLSDFNVLLPPYGPVIIDFPQAVDPATNNNARKLLVRDVKNLTSFLGRFAPGLKKTRYGEEMWALYERAELAPDTRLTGRFKGSDRSADTSSLLAEIEAVEREARARREALGLPPPRRRATGRADAPAPKPIGARAEPRDDGGKKKRRRKKKPSDTPRPPAQTGGISNDELDALLSED